MITKSTSEHKDSKGRRLPRGHYDLHFSDGRVEHFGTREMALEREKQVEMFKHMEGA